MTEIPFQIVEGKIECKKCGKRFDSPTLFEDHLKTCRQAEPKREGLSEENQAEIRRRMAEEERLKELEAKASFKTIDQILVDADKLHEVYVPEIDCKIRYKKIAQAEYLEIIKIEDFELFSQELLCRMWRKGDSAVTLDKVKALPFDLLPIIMERIHTKTPFLHVKLLQERLRAAGGSRP